MSVQFATARSTGFRLSALALAIAVSAPLIAQAQSAEVVDVIGQAAQLEQALDDQRRANTIKSVRMSGMLTVPLNRLKKN